MFKMKKTVITAVAAATLCAAFCVARQISVSNNAPLVENVEALSDVELWPYHCFLGVVEASIFEPLVLEVRDCYQCRIVWATKAEYPLKCR